MTEKKNRILKIVRWVIAVDFMLAVLGSLGSGWYLSAVLFAIAAVVTVPLGKTEQIWSEKIPNNAVRKGIRIGIAIVALIAACLLTPTDETQQTAESTTEAETIAEETYDEKISAEPEEYSDVPEETEETAVALSEIPEYSGSAYVEINGNQPTFSEADRKRTDAFETYSDLDSLGRCGVAYANICKELMPTEKRGEIGSVKPTGWHTVKYPELISDRYLYNRCHLIAYMLAGENANERNLITGVRSMNLEMLTWEEQVDDYVESTGNHVLYRVTPIFDGDNLVASGVQMEGYSVEDEGAGICFNVYCYNVQPGIIIDYATGDSSVDPNYKKNEAGSSDTAKSEETVKQKTESTTVTEAPAVTETAPASTSYVLNTNTKKFHTQDCGSAKTIAEKNKAYSNETRDSLIAQGYIPCQNCNP